MDDHELDLDHGRMPMRLAFRSDLRSTVIDAWRADASEAVITGSSPVHRPRWMAVAGALGVAAAVIGGLVVVNRGPDREQQVTFTTQPEVVTSSTSPAPTTVDAASAAPGLLAPAVFDIDMYGRAFTGLTTTDVFAAPGEEVFHAALDWSGRPYVLHAPTASFEPLPLTVEVIEDGIARSVPMPNDAPVGFTTESIADMLVGPQGVLYLDIRTPGGDRSVVAIGDEGSGYTMRLGTVAVPSPSSGAGWVPPIEMLADGVAIAGEIVLPWFEIGGQGTLYAVLGGSVGLVVDGPHATVTRRNDESTTTWNLDYRSSAAEDSESAMTIDRARAFPSGAGGAIIGLGVHEGDLRAIEFTELTPDGTANRWANLNSLDAVPVGVAGTTAYFVEGPPGQRVLRAGQLVPAPVEGVPTGGAPAEVGNYLEIVAGDVAAAMVLEPFAQIFAGLDRDVWPERQLRHPAALIAVAQDGLYVVDDLAGTLQVLGADGQQIRSIALDLAGGTGMVRQVLAGPESVAYIDRTLDAPYREVLTAVRTRGDRAGQVAAEIEVGFLNGDAQPYHDPTGVGDPLLFMRSGQFGIMHRLATGSVEPLMPYVTDGVAPAGGVQQASAFVDVTVDGSLIYDSDPSVSEWRLDVRSAPGAAVDGFNEPFAGPSGVIVTTALVGPRPVDATVSGPIIIVLPRSPGKGQWWHLAEGWTMASSSPWGTLASRRAGGATELAWVISPRFDLGGVESIVETTLPTSVVPLPADSGILTPGILADGTIVLPKIGEYRLAFVDAAGDEIDSLPLDFDPSSVNVVGDIAEIHQMDGSGIPHYRDLATGRRGALVEGLPADVPVVSRPLGAGTELTFLDGGREIPGCSIRLFGNDWVRSQLFNGNLIAVVMRDDSNYAVALELTSCSGGQMRTVAPPEWWTAWTIVGDGVRALVPTNEGSTVEVRHYTV